MIRLPPRSTLFSLHDALPISSPQRALPGPIAYFCAEYGIHESMQIYSGGLGVLAGDHCKSASDAALDRKSTRLNSSHGYISYAVFCLKKKNTLCAPVTQRTAQ